MVDLSIIYSKTGKGLRARNAAVAGISTKQLKVLSFIDGKSKAEEILTQSNEITEKDLATALSQLETDGFIRPLAKAQPNAEDWALTSNFAPMVVEEFKNIEEIEAETKVKADKEKQEAERIATEMAKEKIRWKAEISARKEAEAKEKAETATKEKARLEQERIAREAALAQKKKDEEQKKNDEAQKKRDEEIQAKAKRKAESEEQAKLKAQADAERKAQEEADKRARAEAKENARRELERINREAAEAQKKAEAEAKLKAAEEARLEAERIAKAENEAQLEAARKAKAELKAQQDAEQAKLEAEQARLEIERIKKAEEAQLEAERIAKAENEAQLVAARKAKAELKAQEAAELERTKLAEKQKSDSEAKEAARLEMARVVRKAEDERKSAEAAAKEARLEAKRQIKAEEQARIKAVRKAKDDEKQARIDAEAAENSKIAQQESVQLEMDRLAPVAEEAKIITEEAKSNDDAINQAQLAPPQSDLLTSKIAEQQAVLQAEEASQAAKQQEKEAEQEKQLEATQALEKAEQIRAKNEADEKAALEAKELAKQEMARIAREADALRSQANNPALTKPTKSGRFEASRTTKLKKSTIQAEKNAKNIAETQAREAEKRAYIALTEKQSAAKHQEETKQPIKTKRLSIDLSSLLLKCLKWIAKLVKTTLVYGFLLTLLLIGILHFINISPLIAPIEKLATDSLGKPVHIEQVRASLWPQPHLALGNVAIGDTLKATSMQVIPDATTLFDDVKHVKSLTIQGLVIEQNNADESLQAIQNIGKATSLKIEQLNVSDLSFKLKDLVLGPFDGKLVLNDASELNNVDLHSADNTLIAQIKPQGADYAVTLTGAKWVLPLNPNIVFDELKADVSIHQNQLTFSQINGEMFGGNINAKAVLDWSGDWRTTGSFTLTNANAPQLLKAFASKASVDGKANLTGDFTSQSTEALKLSNTPTITANIALKNGKINGVDLEHAVMAHQNTSLAGEATDFDKLSANLYVKDGQYHYKQIALDTDQFHAHGNVEIAQNQAISGRVNASLNAQSRRLQANFGLGGTLDNVKRQ
jgi:hypothetical protein